MDSNVNESNSSLQTSFSLRSFEFKSQDVANAYGSSTISDSLSFNSRSQNSSISAIYSSQSGLHYYSSSSRASSIASFHHQSSTLLNISSITNNSSRSIRNGHSNNNILNTSTISNVAGLSTSFYSTEIIMSIVEGRGKAKNEIGLAYLDLRSPILYLSQFLDNYSYDSLRTKCNVSTPVEIIFPHTLSENNVMMSTVIENFPDIDFKPFDRKFFNEKKGFEYIQTLSFDDCQWIDLQLENKYYCLAACSALYRYILTVKQIQYAPKSIKIIYQSSLNTLIIDPTTSKILELIINLSNPRSSDTLFGTINRTKTKSGFMMLRSSILQPSTSLDLITKRLNIVEAITSSMENFNSFENVLMNFSAVDLDQLLVNLVQLPTYNSTTFLRLAEKKIDYVINMKHAISLVDQLRQTLQECDQNLFDEYIQRLNDDHFETIKDLIDKVINSNTKCMKGSANMKLEKCFAIKDRINPLLDIARSIYSETIDDIIALVQTYETKYYADGIKINYSTSKGFYMQIKQIKNRSMPKLPSIFKNVTVTKNYVQFTSIDLMRLNNRVKQSVEEIYLQSDNIITKLINDIRANISCLYDLTDIIANIDLLFSFAYQASCCNYIRPNFSTKYTHIINGTHPVLDKISVSVPNSIFLSDDLNFHIITGPNMSGKTTFIKQIALLQIMAQIGSFVPAESASFRICDKLFTRMAFNDNLQMNSSSFMVEIKELYYILNHLTPNCLILIDELGKDNSFEESFSTYWSICESLLLSPAFTIFATHFLHLTELFKFYLNVTNHHFSSETIENNSVCKYPHILLSGPTKERNYGIKLAEMSGLDENIISYAKNVSSELARNDPSTIYHNNNDDATSTNDNSQICEYHSKYRIAIRLIHLIKGDQSLEIDMDLIKHLQIDYEQMKRQFNMAIINQ